MKITKIIFAAVFALCTMIFQQATVQRLSTVKIKQFWLILRFMLSVKPTMQNLSACRLLTSLKLNHKFVQILLKNLKNFV